MHSPSKVEEALKIGAVARRLGVSASMVRSLGEVGVPQNPPARRTSTVCILPTICAYCGAPFICAGFKD